MLGLTLLLEPSVLLQLAGVSAEPTSATASRPLFCLTPRIQVVADSSSVRRALERTLRREGYEVVTAVDAQEALEYVLGGGVSHAVLTDLEMPRMSGFALIEWLRAQPRTAALPIGVITTRAG